MNSNDIPAPQKKRLSRPRRIIVLAIFALVGLYTIPRLWTTIRFAGQAHVPSLNDGFARLDSLLPGTNSPIRSVHRGLSHNYFHTSQFLRDVWLSPTWSYHGYRFQLAEWEASPAFSAALQTMLTQKQSFKPYLGPKLCGGYHADWFVEFTTPDGPVQFMVCLGCHEVLIFGPRESCIIELSKEATETLAWKYAAKESPKPSEE